MTYGGFVKVWDGSAWQWRVAKVWNGSSWSDRPVYHRETSAWKAAWSGTGSSLPAAYNSVYEAWGTVASFGIGVVPGANNTKGSWVQVASSANLSQNIYDIFMMVHSGSSGGNARQMLMDIGVDAAGGTSYTTIISNLAMGATGASSNSGRRFRFPYYIPAGSSVAVRIQCGDATVTNVRVAFTFAGAATPSASIPYGTYTQTFGTITNSTGTPFTMGASGSDGAWVSMGTASNSLWSFQVGVQLDNAIQLGGQFYVDIAVGDAVTKQVINRIYSQTNTNELFLDLLDNNVLSPYFPVSAGQEIWIRGRHASATPDSGFNATVIGIGG